MAKKLDFDKEKNNRNDNVIEEIMQADFPLPKQAEDAKNEAFSRIREMAAASGHTENTENMVQRLQEKSTEKSTGSSGKKSTGTAKSHKKFKTVYKTALGLTAAAAVFSTVCITCTVYDSAIFQLQLNGHFFIFIAFIFTHGNPPVKCYWV